MVNKACTGRRGRNRQASAIARGLYPSRLRGGWPRAVGWGKFPAGSRPRPDRAPRDRPSPCRGGIGKLAGVFARVLSRRRGRRSSPGGGRALFRPPGQARGDGAPRGASIQIRGLAKRGRIFCKMRAPGGAPSRRLFGVRAALRPKRRTALTPSASSSRGGLVPPSGAPSPPGSGRRVPSRPQAPHPAPSSRRLMMTPSTSRTRGSYSY